MSIRSIRKSRCIGMSQPVRVYPSRFGSVFRNVLLAGSTAADSLLLPVSDFVTRAGTWPIVWTSSGTWFSRWRTPRNRAVQHVQRGPRVNAVCVPNEPKPIKSRLGVPPGWTTDGLFPQQEGYRQSSESPPRWTFVGRQTDTSIRQTLNGHRTYTIGLRGYYFPLLLRSPRNKRETKPFGPRTLRLFLLLDCCQFFSARLSSLIRTALVM